MARFIEAAVTINDVSLSPAQSMTLRVAVATLMSDMSTKDALGSDEIGRSIAKGYRDACWQILELVLTKAEQG